MINTFLAPNTHTHPLPSVEAVFALLSFGSFIRAFPCTHCPPGTELGAQMQPWATLWKTPAGYAVNMADRSQSLHGAAEGPEQRGAGGAERSWRTHAP